MRRLMARGRQRRLETLALCGCFSPRATSQESAFSIAVVVVVVVKPQARTYGLCWVIWLTGASVRFLWLADERRGEEALADPAVGFCVRDQ